MIEKIKILFYKVTLTSLSIFALLLIYSQSGFINFMIFLFSLSIHELSHIACIKMFNIQLEDIKLMPFGARITIKENNASVDKLLCIFLSGPLSNFIFAGIIIISNLYLYVPSYDFFVFYNILLGCINLIPTIPLDLSRCLYSLLCIKLNKLDAFKYVFLISVIIDLAVLFLGVYIVLSGQKNVLLIFLSVFLFNNLRAEKDKVYFSFIKENKILKSIE